MFFNKKHEHNYKILGCSNEIIRENEFKERQWTYVLMQCECGEYTIDTFPGTWKIDILDKIN